VSVATAASPVGSYVIDVLAAQNPPNHVVLS
jgi:hypothetical protein